MNQKLLVTASVIGLLTSFGAQATSCASGVFKIYMATDGSDSNPGTTDAEILTLERANAMLEAAQPNCNVEVHIKPGTYVGQSVSWTFISGKRITFTPADYQTGSANMPRFISDGSWGHTFGSWEPSTDKDPGIWFDLRDRSGRWTNVHHRYIWVEGYGAGVRWFGDPYVESRWQGNNSLYGMYFKNMGGKYNGFNYGKSYSAVSSNNSRGNRIENSHFVNIENTAADGCGVDNKVGECMHAIYMANFSSDSYIARNRITNVSGNPLQNRDKSNNNTYEHNIIKNSGYLAQIQDWYCDNDNQNGKCGVDTECPSYNVKFYNNTFGNLYDGTYQPKVWHTFGQDDHCGPLQDKRLRTYGNVYSPN